MVYTSREASATSASASVNSDGSRSTASVGDSLRHFRSPASAVPQERSKPASPLSSVLSSFSRLSMDGRRFSSRMLDAASASSP